MSGSDSPTFFHGQPWSSWIEKMGRDKPLSDEEPDSEPASSVMRLPIDDIDLYGFCPERDSFYVVVCEVCNAVVKPQAFQQHMESNHPSGNVSLPPPSNTTTKPPLKTPYYRHCGVWIEETSKPCTRSLTCKAHPVSLRRHVSGRSKSFDKLLADHRASKDLPNTKAQTKVISCSATAVTTVTGTISIAAAELNTANALMPSTPATAAVAVAATGGTAATPTTDNTDAPGSPPVLSLPDTYPLPQAVDLLYRCLAPHGTNKPTKLEENYPNDLESSRRIESTSLVNNANNGSNISASALTPGGTSNVPVGSDSAMAPISVVLPSLSPIPTDGMSPQTPTLQFSRSVNPSTLPMATLEAKTAPMEMDNGITMYTSSPVSTGKSQVSLQIPRGGMMNQSMSNCSFTSLFDQSIEGHHSESARTVGHVMVNGKRLTGYGQLSAGLQNDIKPKLEYPQEYSSAIQLEAMTTSAPFTDFNDISWSNCHPEPLAVGRWLRINSSRKQYNFNIH
ncbi:hypothetical protein QAD02_018366 [Eretmocerus hayati]|uniref:Uncharacterized protein n=1 Tax=Eretmocerus hayati TaxID=131215 RepID=A0ACC2PGZ6_9HYME|nr:hypothetical protein QAD02_018366 [Eretmocerus hayati]